MSEMKKTIGLEIDATLKGGELDTKLEQMFQSVQRAREGIQGMRDDLAEMPMLGDMLNAKLQTTGSLAETMERKITSLRESQDKMDDDTRAQAVENLNNTYREFSTLREMQNDASQTYGIGYAKQFAANLSKDLSGAFDRIMPQVVNMIRTKMNSGRDIDASYANAHTIEGIQIAMSKDKGLLNLLRNGLPTEAFTNGKVMDQFFGIAASQAADYHRLNAFTQKMFGVNASRVEKRSVIRSTPAEYIPESFKPSFESRGYVGKEKFRSSDKVISNDIRSQIVEALNNNPVLLKAANDAKLIQKDAQYGNQHLIENITDSQMDEFRRQAYRQLEIRGRGTGKYELARGIYSGEASDDKGPSEQLQSTIANRFQTGTTRQAVEGLVFLDRLGDKDENYVTATRGGHGQGSIIRPQRQLLDMYQIGRATPFVGGKPSIGRYDYVSVNESDITRILGLDKRGDRSKAYREMSTISLNGYDPKNKEHVDLMKRIYENGIWVDQNTGAWRLDRPMTDDGQYDSNYVQHKFHAAHRGEDGAVLRMLNADMMEQIAKTTGERAKELGLSGNFLNMYSANDAKEFGQMLEDGTYLANDASKYFDAINKMYSPSRKIENNLTGKNVAVVDFAANGFKYADGVGWVSSDYLSHAIQARGASGFKGQLMPFQGGTIRDYLVKTGLASTQMLNENGEYVEDPTGKLHYYMKSINGTDMIDVMDAQILTDASLWKNAARQFKYQDENGNWQWHSGEKINQLASKLIGEVGLSEMVDLDRESGAASLGTQLTSYLTLNPMMRKLQTEGLKKRLAELDTYEGMKKYVFSNPEADEMSAVLQDPANEWLLNTKAYRDRVDLYRQSLIHDVSTHKFVDFDNGSDYYGYIADELFGQDWRNGKTDLNKAQSVLNRWRESGYHYERDLRESGISGVPELFDMIDKNANGEKVDPAAYLGQLAQNINGQNGSGSFTNVTNSVGLFSALLQNKGEIPAAIMDTARKALNEKYGEGQYSDEDIKDILLLRKKKYTDENGKERELSNVIDFGTDERHVAYARSPSAFGAFIHGVNRAEEMRVIQNAMLANGTSNPLFNELFSAGGDPFLRQSGVYLGQDDWKDLSGADADGDRIKRITGVYAQMIQASRERADDLEEFANQVLPGEAKRIGELKLADLKTLDKIPNNVQAFLNDIERLSSEGREMGLANATALNPMQMSLDDFTANGAKFVLSAKYGNKIYDEYASTFRKNPKNPIIHGDEWYRAQTLGQNFDAYLSHEDRLFQFNDDQKDTVEKYRDNIKALRSGNFSDKTKEAIEEEQKALKSEFDKLGIFESSYGELINLKQFEGPDGRTWGMNINMPSVNMDGHISGIAAAQTAYRMGRVDLSKAESVSEAIAYMIEHSPKYAEATDEVKDYHQAYLQMFPQFSSGARGRVSEAELADLQSKRLAAQASIRNMVTARKQKDMAENGLDKYSAVFSDGTNIADYEKELLKKYHVSDNGIDVVSNLGLFGFTSRNLRESLNDQGYSFFFNDPNTRLVKRNQTMMQQMQEAEQVREDELSERERIIQEGLNSFEADANGKQDTQAAAKANQEANNAEAKASQAEIDAANARKDAAEARTAAANSVQSEAQAQQAQVQKSQAKQKHALDYAEYTVTRTMQWMKTDTVDDRNHPAISLDNVYHVDKDGKATKGDLAISMKPYEGNTMAEGRLHQARTEKAGHSESGADAIIGSLISHVMDDLGANHAKNGKGIAINNIRSQATTSMKKFYADHENEIKALGITFDNDDLFSNTGLSHFHYSGTDDRLGKKIGMLSADNMASYFVDDILGIKAIKTKNDEARRIVSTEGKIYGKRGKVLNESTMVAGPSGGEKEIAYTLPGIKNSKGEDVVTRFAPDYVVQNKEDKLIIGDHKSSDSGTKKGLLQTLIYASWLDDLAEQYHRSYNATTKTYERKDLEAYGQFGSIDGNGKYVTNIAGVETRDFFSRAGYMRRYSPEDRTRFKTLIRDAQDSKYLEALDDYAAYGLQSIPEPTAENNPTVAKMSDRQRNALMQQYQMLSQRYAGYEDFARSFHSGMMQEVYRDREGTYADNYFSQKTGMRNAVVRQSEELQKAYQNFLDQSGMKDDSGLLGKLNQDILDANEAFSAGTRAWSENRSIKLLENAENFSLRKTDPFYKQREEIDKQRNNVTEMESAIDNFILSRINRSNYVTDENGKVIGINENGNTVNIRDAKLVSQEDTDTVSSMKTRLESLKTTADENIQLINDQIERDVDKQIADMQEASDSVTKTHQTSGQQRKNYWDKRKRKLNDSVKDMTLARDAIDKMLEDTETYKEDDPKRKQLERLRDQYNKSIGQESEYLNNGGFDKDRQDDLEAQRISRFNKLRHYFSGTRESAVAQMVSTGMLAMKDLDNRGDTFNVGNQFYQGMTRMLDESIGTERTKYANFVDDLSRAGNMSAEERINRNYQNKRIQSLASIRQMQQEAIDLDRMLDTGKDLEGREIFSPDDNSATTQGIKDRIKEYRDFLKDVSKQAQEALDKTLPDQKDRDVARALEDIKAQNEMQADRYQYGANQIQRSEAARRRQLDMHLSGSHSVFRQELEWRRSQYDNATSRRESYSLRQKQLDAERTKLQRQLDDDNANGKKLSAEKRTGIENQLNAATAEYNALGDAIDRAKQEQEEFGASGQEAAAALTVIGTKISAVAKQFGARIWRKAIQETMQFVQQYDAAMTEIQMVTLKSDSEIANIGKGLINSAVEMKAPIADVTSAATALYRQGLGDEEVQTRLEDVIKFSTTAGVKAADAVKLITVSLSSGLVESSTEAMDVISALGDSAATTAAEITKGLQKSVYAAKDVGVTYQELVSMLTAITAGTQLGGNVAGTAMQTFMSRFARIGTNEITYDEDGNEISGSNLATALRAVGIETYKNGSRRDFTEVLRELSSQWGSLSDARRSQISYAFGGTRQYSNLNALLTAFGEKDENGQTAIDKYLDITGKSAGVTDEKYTHYTESLAASVTNLKNSFDGLIESLTNTGVLTGFLDFISSAIQGATQLSESLGSLGGVISSLSILAIPIISLLIGGVPGLVAGGLAAAGLSTIYASINAANNKPSLSNYAAAKSKVSSEQTLIDEKVQRAKELNGLRDKDGNLSEENNIQLKKTLAELSDMGALSLDASTSIESLASSAANTAKALDSVSASSKTLSDKQKQELWNGLVADIKNDKDKFSEIQQETIISDEEKTKAREAINSFSPEKGLAALSIMKDITPVIGAIDWTGFGNVVQKVGSNEYTTVSQMSNDEIARAFTQYLRYHRSPNEKERLSVEQYAGIYDKISGVIGGAKTDTKDEVKFGDYYKDKISAAVKDMLTGSLEDDEIQQVVGAIVKDLNEGKSIDDVNVLDYASSVIRNAGKKTSSTNLKAIADLTYSMSEEGKKKTQGQRFDRLYKALAISGAPVQTWLNSMKLDANSALFNSYMSDPNVAKAFSEMVDESGNYNGNQKAYQNFLNTIAAASNYYGSSVYTSNKQMSSNAFGAFTKRRRGINVSELGPEYSESEMKTILGDELFSEFVSGNWAHAGEMRRRIEAYGVGLPAYTDYQNATAATRVLNNGAADFSNTRLQEIYQTIPELQEYLAVQGYSEQKRSNLGYSDNWLENQRSIIEKRINEIETSSKILESAYSDISTNVANGFSMTAYAPDALSTYGDLISQYDNFAETQRSLNRLKSNSYNEEDLQRLASQTGVNIRASNASNESIKKNVEAAFNVQLDNYVNGITEGLETLIPQSALDTLTEGMNADDIVSALQDAGVKLNDWAINAIKDLGLVFQNGKFVPNADGLTDAFGDAIKGMLEGVSNSNTASSTALNAVKQAVLMGGGVAGYKDYLNTNYKNVDISALSSNAQNILGMYENGLSSANTSTLLEYESSPYRTKGSDYYKAYLDFYNANKNNDDMLNSTYMQNAQSILSSLDGWQEYVDTGNMDKLNAAIELAGSNKYTDAYSQFATYLTQFYGTQSQQNELMTSMFARGKSLRYNNYLSNMLEGGASGDAFFGEVASALGGSWTADLVKENKGEAKKQLDNMKDTSKEAINTLISSVIGEIAELKGVKLDIDTENIVEILRNTGNELASKLANYIEAMGNVDIGAPEKTLGNIAQETRDRAMQGSNYYKYGLASELHKAGISIYDETGVGKFITDNPEYSKDAVESLLGDSDFVHITDAASRGVISGEMYDKYLSTMQSGHGNMNDVYMNALDHIFGVGEQGTFLRNFESASPKEAMSMINELQVPDYSWIMDWINSLNGGKDALDNIAAGGEQAAEGIKQLTAAMKLDAAEAGSAKNELVEITNIINDLKKGGQDAGKAVGQLSKKVNDAYDKVLASGKIRGKSGKEVDKTTRGIIGEFLGVSDDKQIQKMTKEQMNHVADLMEASGKDAIDNGFVKTFEDELMSALNSLDPGSKQYELVNSILLKAVADGQIDTSELEQVIAALQNDVLSTMYAAAGPIGSLMLSIFASTNSITAALQAGGRLGSALLSGAKANVKLNTGKNAKYQSHGGGGGGGGGGKEESAAQKLVKRVNKGDELFEYQRKMIQYNQTRYENRGELQRYGAELQNEIDLEKAYLPVLKQNIDAMMTQLKSTSKGSEDWYTLREAIFKVREEYSDITNTIEENTKKLKENEDAIRQTRTNLEDMVKGVIEERIQKQRDMLAGTVDIQGLILDAIKQRYQDEWDLIKKDIEKKKEALEQEKSLIDERLNKRKSAADEAKKYEELAEMKDQLSRISMDSTRTKDAAALRERISELEQEIGWDIADKQAEAEKQGIDDQIKAYDEQISEGDEDLAAFLEDANNFSEEITKILEMNHDDLFAWLRNNVDEFKDSLDEAQQQMIDSWNDTYKQMYGITDTYWDEIDAILKSKDTFIAEMMNSEEYKNASDTEKESLLYKYDQDWESYYNAYFKKPGDVWGWSSDQFGDWSGSEYAGAGGGGGSGGAASSGGGPGNKKPEDELLYYAVDERGNLISYGYKTKAEAQAIANRDQSAKVMQLHKSNAAAEAKANTAVGSIVKKTKKAASNIANSAVGKTVTSAVQGAASTISSAASKVASSIADAFKKILPFDTGGYTGDQEGIAYIHKKERILNPQQTESFEKLSQIADSMNRTNMLSNLLNRMDSFSSSVSIPKIIPDFSPADFKQSTTTTIGDIIITLNEARLENDADYEMVAQRVGENFVKELTKQGLGVSVFGF